MRLEARAVVARLIFRVLVENCILFRFRLSSGRVHVYLRTRIVGQFVDRIRSTERRRQQQTEKRSKRKKEETKPQGA
jgi:hypothetical protein